MAEKESLQNQHQDLNHDQGELLKFLPSGIFPLDQQPRISRHGPPKYSNYNHHHHHHHHHSYADHAACCMDTQDFLSRGFAPFSFIGHSPQPPQRFSIAPAPELFRMADQRAFPGPLPDWCCLCGECMSGAHQVCQYGAGAGWPSHGPGHSYEHRNPVQTQAECFMEERARALRYHSWVNRATKNRMFPFRGGGLIGGFGFVGGTGTGTGTGVYLPRLPPNNISSTTTTANHIDRPRARRRQGGRRRRDNEAQLLMSMVQKKNQEGFCSQASPEVGLPEDWTY